MEISSDVTPQLIDALILELNTLKFSDIQSSLSRIVSRKLIKSERLLIAQAIARAEVIRADAQYSETFTSLNGTHHSDYGVAIATAFSDNYDIGFLCSSVNRRYADQHGYAFFQDVLPLEDMMSSIAPRTHCTWYKVKLILELLQPDSRWHRTEPGSGKHYLLWIDADAIVINFEKAVQQVINCGQHRDLIVAEDMNPCCLLNAGVLLIRDSLWSIDLWTQVWHSNRYFDVFFYEQSALISCLKTNRERLELSPAPFHTYLPGSRQGAKVFAHVTVLPHYELNSNAGYELEDPKSKLAKKKRRTAEKIRRRELQLAGLLPVSGGMGRSAAVGSSSSLESSAEKQAPLLTDVDTEVACSLQSRPPAPLGSLNEVEGVWSKLPQFIFHPAGNGDKRAAIQHMMDQHCLLE